MKTEEAAFLRPWSALDKSWESTSAGTIILVCRTYMLDTHSLPMEVVCSIAFSRPFSSKASHRCWTSWLGPRSLRKKRFLNSRTPSKNCEIYNKIHMSIHQTKLLIVHTLFLEITCTVSFQTEIMWLTSSWEMETSLSFICTAFFLLFSI